MDGEAIGGTMVRYGYDNSGNRTYEQYSGLDTTGSAPGNVIQSSQIYYDELNRMIRVVDPAEEDIRYEYDAVGNRREVDAYYRDPLSGGLRDHDTFWYTYDATNRFTLTKGSLDQRGTSATDARWSINRGGTVSGQGVQITYDQRGDRMTALNADDSLEKYTYSQDGFLMETRVQAPGAGAAVMEARRVIDGLGRTTEYAPPRSSSRRAPSFEDVAPRMRGVR